MQNYESAFSTFVRTTCIKADKDLSGRLSYSEIMSILNYVNCSAPPSYIKKVFDFYYERIIKLRVFTVLAIANIICMTVFILVVFWRLK